MPNSPAWQAGWCGGVGWCGGGGCGSGSAGVGRFGGGGAGVVAIGLATALLHGPRLLVLDEPFEAVDPVSAAVIKRILKRFTASGGAVLLSSHVMALVEQLCDTVAIMDKGQVVAEGPVERVRGGRTLEETFVELVGRDAGNGDGLSWLSR
jgi:ABC-2 type transport system ATP-binding protein